MKSSWGCTARASEEERAGYLWEQERWIPAHQLIKLDTPYGYVGNSGDVRARELARNECPDKLKDKVERAEGRDIGLDKRFVYFRYKRKAQPITMASMLAHARQAVAEFDKLPA